MSGGRFHRAIRVEALGVPPIWLMRRAGRHHAPYRQPGTKHRLEDLCRTPEFWRGPEVEIRRDPTPPLHEAPRRGFVPGNFDPVAPPLTGEPLEREGEPWRQSATARQRGICSQDLRRSPGIPEAGVRTLVNRARNGFAAANRQ